VAASAAQAADLGLIVVPADVRAVTAARRVVIGLHEQLGDLRLVVRGPARTGVPAEMICDVLNLPLAGILRPEPGLRMALDRGEPPGLHTRGPLSKLCRQLVAVLLADVRLDGSRA
jgi:hypothetical protein